MARPVPARLLSFLLIAALVVSGCLGGLETGPAETATGFGSAPRLLEVLLQAPPLTGFDRAAAVDEWERFVYAYPKRDWTFPHNHAAAEFLREELEEAGFTAEVLSFTAEAALVSYFGVEQKVNGPVQVVRGTKMGDDPTHRFALVAHYDTVTATTMGAYDDASGTMVELDVCRHLAKVKTNRTIDCLFFDAEERGLQASKAYVKAYREGQLGDFTYDLAFGYDMTGINWPGYPAWPLYVMVGTQAKDHPELENLTEPLHAFLDFTLREFLDERVVPGAGRGVSILDVHDRNSDEQSFKKQGVPVVRFTGLRNAADYPQYHQPNDTPPYVYEYAGGKENFAQGFEFAVLASYYAILGFDAFDPWTLEF